MKPKPDIIWIYCDELRVDALGCYGHPTMRMHTPNIDRLAASGVRFTNNFCNSPICVASTLAITSARIAERASHTAAREYESPRCARPSTNFREFASTSR